MTLICKMHVTYMQHMCSHVCEIYDSHMYIVCDTYVIYT